MNRSLSKSQRDYQQYEKERQNHQSRSNHQSNHPSNHQSNHQSSHQLSHQSNHQSGHQSNYQSSNQPNYQSNYQSNNQSSHHLNHDSNNHGRQPKPPSPAKPSVTVETERPAKRARVELVQPVVETVIEFDGDSVFDDLDDDEREAREQREAAERRRRRAEILAKHSQIEPSSQSITSQTLPPSAKSVDVKQSVGESVQSNIQPNNQSINRSNTPATQVVKQSDLQSNEIAKPLQSTIQSAVNPQLTVDSNQDDDFDIFCDSPSRLIANPASISRRSTDQVSGILETLDAFDDSEGYYKFRAGDILTDDVTGRKFNVLAMQGQGVFSTVVRCREIFTSTNDDAVDDGPECCVKIIRANSTMQAAGEKEKQFLTRIAEIDPSHRSHVMTLMHSFYHRSHLCLVVPAFEMDFRKVIRKFGSVGLSINAVQIFTRQLLQALQVMQKAKIIHADLKPDNILVNEAMNSCAVCDFGSATYVNEAAPAPYLVSRFYRAPEVMLGTDMDCRVDLWSVGTVIYELYTGKILFNGADNNEMLHLIQLLKGPAPYKLLKKGAFAGKHFNDKGQFLKHRVDPATGQRVIQIISIPVPPVHNLSDMIRSYSLASALKDPQEARKIRHLTDFIDSCLHIDPNRRLSLEHLMKHPFVVGEEAVTAVVAGKQKGK